MRKGLRFTRIRTKLAIAFLLQILGIVTLVILFSYFSSVSIIRNKSIDLIDKLIMNGIKNLDSEITSIKHVVYSLFRNEEFINSFPLTSSQSGYSLYDLYKRIGVSLQDVLSTKNNIFSIIYIDNQNNLVYSTRNKTSYERLRIMDDMPPWLNDAIDQLKIQKYGYLMIPTHKHLPLRNEMINEQVYTYASPAIDVNNGYKSVGVLLINFNLSKLHEIAENVKPYDNSFIYIVGDEGTILYDSTQANTGKALRQDVYQKIKSSDNYFTISENDVQYVVVHSESTLTKWKILSFVPVMEYSRDINRMITYITITAIGVILLSIVLTILFSRQFSAPIESLSKIMNKIENGALDLRAEIKSCDEIGTLSRSFNSLISRLNYVMKNEYELVIRQKDAELKALQAQINPHFLFNVLQSINSIAVLHNIDEISTMAMSLGKIMRYSIKTSDNIVSLEHECQHVFHFLEILKVRFGERLKYQVDVPDELKDYSILKLTLQPIVENAIIHAFKNNETQWILLIHASLENGAITIDISDNGIGMSQEKLKKLINDLENTKSGFFTDDFPNIGLKNVYYRLKIYYGNDSEMKIDSEPGEGTIVRIRFPAIPYKEVKAVDTNTGR